MGMKTFIALIISVANYARDVLGRFSTITSSVSSVQSVVSSFAYANDELGRRTQRLDTLPAAPFALTNTFGYNVRSEVVAAIMGANDQAYAYDPIGDLLAADLDGEGVFYSYDTNSNVTDLVDTKGDSVAHYEYGPFGETAAQKGSLVEVNPFHFSTKDLDVRVGLYFYGYRFYNPSLGRWPNRDPIGEPGHRHGGFSEVSPGVPFVIQMPLIDNVFATLTQLLSLLREKDVVRVPKEDLYLFVRNDPHNRIDWLGLKDCKKACPEPANSPVCDEYGDGTYAGISLSCFCKCAGNSDWSQQVRGCLACEHEQGTDVAKAHKDCYEAAGGTSKGPVWLLAICLNSCPGANLPPPPDYGMWP